MNPPSEFSFNLNAMEFNPFGPAFTPTTQPKPEQNTSTSSLSFNVNAPAFELEFSKSSLPVPQLKPEQDLQPQASAVEPKPDEVSTLPQTAQDSRPHEEAEAKGEARVGMYSRDLLLSLRDRCKTIPPEAEIPPEYCLDSAFRKRKGKLKKKRNPHGKFREGPGDRKQDGTGEFFRAQPQLETLTVLKKTENSFAKKMKEDIDEIEKQSRSLRSTLNKISAQNFEKLTHTILNDFNYEGELLDRLVAYIFDRATAHHQFSELYAQLCAVLNKSFRDSSSLLAKRFRNHLLSNCENCFYNQDNPEEGSELMDAEYKRRRKLIGNIKFIGLLFKQKMLKPRIMLECFHELLSNKTLCEEALETMCYLFKETAELLSTKQPKDVHDYYERLIAFRNDLSCSKRIQFMIQDIMDCRDSLLLPMPSQSPSKAVGQGAKEREPNFSNRFSEVLGTPMKSRKEVVTSEVSESLFKDDEQSPSCSPKVKIPERSKERIIKILNGFINDRDVETRVEELKDIIEVDFVPPRELIYQAFKYLICEKSAKEMETTCDLFAGAVKHASGFLKADMIDLG